MEQVSIFGVRGCPHFHSAHAAAQAAWPSAVVVEYEFAPEPEGWAAFREAVRKAAEGVPGADRALTWETSPAVWHAGPSGATFVGGASDLALLAKRL